VCVCDCFLDDCFRYLGGLSRNLTRLCADELGKEAFADKCGAKKLIRFILTEKPKNPNAYVYSEFAADGTLDIVIPKKNVCSCVFTTLLSRISQFGLPFFLVMLTTLVTILRNCCKLLAYPTRPLHFHEELYCTCKRQTVNS